MIKKILAAGFAVLLTLQCGCSYLGADMFGGFADVEEISEGLRGSAMSSVPPQTKPDGSKYTLAYVDIDPYPLTGAILYYIIMGLREEGWITFDSLPFDPEDTDACALIDWLAERDIGPYIRFDSSANYYVAFEEEEDIRASLTNHIKNGTIDIIMTMGTWPASMVKSFDLEFPIMMFCAANPIGSGLVDSVEDSGDPNVWAVFDPTVFERQLIYYYDCVPFNHLGLLYYDESISGLSSYKIAAETLGVKVTGKEISRIDATSRETEDAYYRAMTDEFNKFVREEGIDAFIITTDTIVDVDRTSDLVEIFTSNAIPVFVQVDAGHVQNGALLNISAYEMEGLGVFSARSITQKLTGTPLSEIPQEYKNSPYLILNLDVAERIGYKPTFETLLACEQVFTSRG